MSEDYYSVLGVARDASTADIEKAYRDLARKYHPDMNPDDAESKTKFQQVQQAFDVLKDPEKREMFDRYGSSFDAAGGGPGGGNPFAGGHPGGGGFRFESGGPGGATFDFSEIFGGGGGAGGFEEVFRNVGGGGPAGAGPSRGRDVKHELTVPFTTSIMGGDAQLQVRRAGGKTERIEVKIPPGIESGKKIRLRGQGEQSPNGGASGDLLIQVEVSPHPCFTRKGKNLELRVPLTVSEAALGTKVEVPSPHGAITLTIPSGTSSGARLRMKGHGVKGSGKEPGDLLAEVQIAVGDSSATDAKAAYEQLAGLPNEEKEREQLRAKLVW
ncbi:MAG: J domain-containing protein [Pirellulales bacterium]|nr:J domain-containing protein [Pirellulales bacterium]